MWYNLIFAYLFPISQGPLSCGGLTNLNTLTELRQSIPDRSPDRPEDPEEREEK